MRTMIALVLVMGVFIHASLSRTCSQVIIDKIKTLPLERDLTKGGTQTQSGFRRYLDSGLTVLTLLSKSECSFQDGVLDVSDACFQNLRDGLKVIWNLSKSTNPMFIGLNLMLFQKLYNKGIKGECSFFRDVDLVDISEASSKKQCMKTIIDFCRGDLILPQMLTASNQIYTGFETSIQLLNQCKQTYLSQTVKKFISGKCYVAVEELLIQVHQLQFSPTTQQQIQDNLPSLMALRKKAVETCS